MSDRSQSFDLDRISEKFASILGREYVLDDPVDLSVYDCDAETLDRGLPQLVVLPSSSQEVAAVLAVCHEEGIAVLPRGAGTGLSGGSTPVGGGVCLVLTRMNRIIEIDADDALAVVEVGVTNLAVSRAAAPYSLGYAPDPSSQVASTIGGNIAENAGGPHCLKYGMTNNHVLGMRVALADGTLIELGGRARTSHGLDLMGAIIGSEGTLVVVTEAILRLTPLSQSVETLMAYFPTVGACGQAVSDIVATGVIPAAMEMIDNLTLNAVEDYLSMGLKREAGALLIIELDGPASIIETQSRVVQECLERNGASACERAANPAQRATIWKARKQSFGALGRISPNGYVLDGVIPRSRLAEAIERISAIGVKHELIIANVYHAGDGNLHPCLLYDRDNKPQIDRVLKAGRDILSMCVELGGVLSGEHGIGIEKIHDMHLQFSEIELESMRWIKQSFDARAILNPGKLIPLPKSCGESGGRELSLHSRLSIC